MSKQLFYSEESTGSAYIESNHYQLAGYSMSSPVKLTVNEDCAGWIDLDEDTSVFLVADGLGGLPGGHEISSLAVKAILQYLESNKGKTSGHGLIVDAIDSANQKILDTGTGGATTLVLIELRKGIVRPYWIGDSAVMITGQRGVIKFISAPHSPTGYLQEAGLIDEAQAMSHEQRHVVSNVLGSDDTHIEIGPSIELNDLDTIVIASDGLFDNLSTEEVADRVRKGSLEKAITHLAEDCVQTMLQQHETREGSPDDLTILAIRQNLNN